MSVRSCRWNVCHLSPFEDDSTHDQLYSSASEGFVPWCGKFIPSLPNMTHHRERWLHMHTKRERGRIFDGWWRETDRPSSSLPTLFSGINSFCNKSPCLTRWVPLWSSSSPAFRQWLQLVIIHSMRLFWSSASQHSLRSVLSHLTPFRSFSCSLYLFFFFYFLFVTMFTSCCPWLNTSHSL